MRVTMTCAADHRISSGRSLSLARGATYSLPRAIARALIDRGVATVAAPKFRPKPEKE